MGGRCAERIDIVVGNEKVRVRAVLRERVVAVELQLLTGLPPAINRYHDLRVQSVVELCFQFHFSTGGFEDQPGAVVDASSDSGCRMDF